MEHLMTEKEQKRAAVANRWKEIGENIDVLSAMWDERTLDLLVLILGAGRVELD
jgi:hypothetical protein